MLEPHELRLLIDLTSAHSIAGREEQAIAVVDGWLQRHPNLEAHRDPVGNLVIRPSGTTPDLWFTAHLDHPGFIVTEPGTVEFRGGMRAEYFVDATLDFDVDGAPVAARLDAFDHGTGVGAISSSVPIPVGSVGRFAYRGIGVHDGLLHAPACDDLAGVAAALTALALSPRFGVLLTRAEEVGFVGAIGAIAAHSIPPHSRVVCIEMSRTLPNAPIGAGPIVRVGDRVSVFDPALTNRISDIAAGLDAPTQRKLMDGGACEATAFCAAGWAATCLCLPLGNYHNQGDLDRVEAGSSPAIAAPEFISLDDYTGLLTLIGAVADTIDDAPAGNPLWERLERRYDEQAPRLGLPVASTGDLRGA